MIPTLTQSQVFTALRTFLIAILPVGVEVVVYNVNRVPEPKSINFVIMTPVNRTRLETNIDDSADCRFEGSISGNVLTVTAVSIGTILPGSLLFGTGVASGSKIGVQASGTPGGAGAYAITPSQSLGPLILSSGAKTVLQDTKFGVQLDVHGPDSADNAQVISTLFRDEYAVDAFTALNPAIIPLYADDPSEQPFINGENQYEYRWVIQAALEIQPIVSVPQQYADNIDIGLINVDVVYPPS